MKVSIKKLAVTTAIGTMMLGGFATTPLGLPTATVEAASVSIVQPQAVGMKWITGDKISGGITYKNAQDSIQFTTQRSEKGTLVIDIKKNKYHAMEMYRDKKTMEGSFPADLYAQPYMFDGRNESAKQAISDQNHQKIEFLNRNSAKDFTIRTVFYIDNPKSDKNYYLGGPGMGDPSAFFFEAKFYPNQNLTGLTKTERTDYLERADNNGIPPTKVSHIGRVLIKGKDMVLYNSKGQVHRKLTQNEGLRVYEVQSDRYQVGGGYYVKKSKDTLYYVGHVYSKDRYMYVYNPNGKLFKKFVPKQTARVYSTDKGRYQVGAGYYVIPNFNVEFDR